ncbi:MAG TPA: WD40 repeat domain-containing protein, partial [Polyangiaceae bacterium]|nr:WD40 repeat domain-containing protein [Polyangiaceae bacterium]
GAVLVFESANPTREHRLAVKQKVSALRFHPNAERLVVAGELGMVSIWDFAGTKELELRGHNGTVRALAFAQDGHFLASGGEDHSIRFWDSTTGETGAAPILHSDAITSLSWAEDGKVLAYGSKDKSLHLVELKAAEDKPTLVRYHDDSVDAVALAPDLSELVSMSRDLGAVTWSLDGIRKGSPLVERGNVLSLAVVPGRPEVISGGLGVNGVGIWNVATGEADTRLPAGVDRIRSLAASPDGQKLAFAGSAGRVFLWDLPSRIPLRVFESGRDEVRSVAFSGDNRWLAFGGLDRTLHVVGAQKFEDVARFTNSSPVQGIAFVPHSATIAAVDRDGQVSGYDVAHLRQSFRFKAHDEWALAVAPAPDGKWLVTGGGDRHVKIWEAGGARLLADCRGHEGKVLSVDVSPDGRIVASGSEDKSVRLWDPTTGAELALLAGHSGAVRSVKFAPSGDILMSGSDDGTIRLWRLAVLFTRAATLRQSVATRFHVELVGTRVVRSNEP